jgi:hypothetical protein
MAYVKGTMSWQPKELVLCWAKADAEKRAAPAWVPVVMGRLMMDDEGRQKIGEDEGREWIWKNL